MEECKNGVNVQCQNTNVKSMSNSKIPSDKQEAWKKARHEKAKILKTRNKKTSFFRSITFCFFFVLYWLIFLILDFVIGHSFGI